MGRLVVCEVNRKEHGNEDHRLLLCARVVAAGGNPSSWRDSRYTDPAGDSGGAPDLTALTVTNDAAGNLTIAIATNQPALAADAGVFVFFDTDKNINRDEGVEYALFAGATGWELDRWDGSQYVTAHSTLRELRLRERRLDVQGQQGRSRRRQLLRVLRARPPVGCRGQGHRQRRRAGRDHRVHLHADRAGSAADAACVRPSRHRRGRSPAGRSRFASRSPAATPALPFASGVATCNVTVGLTPLRAAGSVRAGRATCSMLIPRRRTASGYAGRSR